MSIFTIRPSAVAAAALLAVASVGAHAESIPFSAEHAASLTDWSDTLSLGKFDSNLGTLTSISFTLDGTVSGVGKTENTGASDANLTLNLGSDLTLTRPDQSVLVVTNPLFTQAFAGVASFDGTLDFAGASGRVTDSAIASKSGSFTSVSASDFALFSQAGGGNINLGLFAAGKSTTSGTGNVVNQFVTNALGKTTVTYNYTAAVPEPESYALMLAGLGLMGAVARRRRAAR